MTLWGGLLKHPAQRGRGLAQVGGAHLTRMFPRPRLVQHSDLVEQVQALSSLKRDGNVKPCPTGSGGYRGDDVGAQMAMHVTRGNDHARACFLDLAADLRVQKNQLHIASADRDVAAHQTSALSASLPNSGQTSASPPAAAMAWLSCAQPSRALRLTERISITPLMTCKSATTSNPNCSSIG